MDISGQQILEDSQDDCIDTFEDEDDYAFLIRHRHKIKVISSSLRGVRTSNSFHSNLANSTYFGRKAENGEQVDTEFEFKTQGLRSVSQADKNRRETQVSINDE